MLQRKFLLVLLTSFIFCFSYPAISQTTITSLQTGSWNSSSTWQGGTVPGSTDNAIISDGTTVTLVANTTINNLTIEGGGVLNADNKQMTVNGKLIVDGTFTSKFSAASNLEFDGDTLGGLGSIIIDATTRSMNLNNDAVILSTSDLTLYGNANISSGATVTNKGIIELTGNLTGNNAISSVWTNADNSTLIISGALLSTGVLNANATGNTINYNYTGDQDIKDPASSTYYNLCAGGTGNKNLFASVLALGDLQINNSAVFVSNNFDIEIRGDWLVQSSSSSFSEGTSNVSFTGTADQEITNTLGETFFDLTVNKTSGNLTINNNVTVSNSFVFQNGIVTTGSNILTLGTGTGNTGTLSYTGGFINGYFERWINATGTISFLWGLPAGIVFG